MPCITSPWLVYFITGSLYLLTLFVHYISSWWGSISFNNSFRQVWLWIINSLSLWCFTSEWYFRCLFSQFHLLCYFLFLFLLMKNLTDVSLQTINALLDLNTWIGLSSRIFFFFKDVLGAGAASKSYHIDRCQVCIWISLMSLGLSLFPTHKSYSRQLFVLVVLFFNKEPMNEWIND